MQKIRKAEHISFPDELVDPHRLTKKTIASFNKGKIDEKGILLSRNKIHLNILVTQETLDRACLIMDTLIKELESHELKVLIAGEQPLQTVIKVNGENIQISLNEKIRRTNHELTTEEKQKYKERYWMLPRYDYRPTSGLSLNIRDWHAPRKCWSDGKRQKLENCLGSFIQGLREAAIQIKIIRKQRRFDDISWKEQKKRREERDQLIRIEKRKSEKLISDANSWQQAELLRAYIRQMESLPEISKELTQWIKWATSYVENTDPLKKPSELPFIINEHSFYY